MSKRARELLPKQIQAAYSTDVLKWLKVGTVDIEEWRVPMDAYTYIPCTLPNIMIPGYHRVGFSSFLLFCSFNPIAQACGHGVDKSLSASCVLAVTLAEYIVNVTFREGLF